MSLVNICTADLGATIIAFSSTSDEQICQPSHVLIDKEDKIWNSGQGLPQYLVVSLEHVEFKFSHIDTVGFYCWHDYTTNPKTIQIQVAEQQDGQLIPWAEVKLKLQNGKQFFSIPQLPPCYKIIKFVITETFGEDETYLNQIMLMATPLESAANSEMSIHQLEYAQYQRNQNYTKTKPAFNAIPGPKSNYKKVDVSNNQDEEEHLYHQSTFRNKKNQESEGKSKSKAEIQRQQEQYSHEQEVEQGDSSFSKNVALLELSQKMIEMEENIQTVRRNLQVLELKMNVSYQNLEKNIMEKVDIIIDKKMKKMQQQILSQIKKSKAEADLREVRSQNDRRQFASSRQELLQDNRQEYFNPKRKSSRQNIKSLHLHQLNLVEQPPKQSQKNTVISSLMNRLADKLKQREVKVKKMETKGKEEYQSKRSNKPQHF